MYISATNLRISTVFDSAHSLSTFSQNSYSEYRFQMNYSIKIKKISTDENHADSFASYIRGIIYFLYRRYIAFHNKSVVDCLYSLFEVLVFHSDDDVHFAGALVYHSDVDSCLCQCSKQLS